MTVTRTAAYHNASRERVWRWISRNLVPVVPIDRGYLVRRVDCEAFRKPKAGAPRGNLNAIGGRKKAR
jgi:hypothetical protein